VGELNVRLPQLQRGLGISEGIYGLVLLAMPVGVLLGSILIPRQIDRFGARRLIAVGLVFSTALQVAVALSPDPWSLSAMLFVYGLFFAAGNVSINVEANSHEAATGAVIMSRCHGWWALGFLAMSLLAVGIVRLGIAPVWQFAGHAVAMAALVGVFILPMADRPPSEGAAPAKRFAVPGRAVLLIGAWSLAGILLEGTTRSWIVIYLRDTYGAADALAALGLPAVVLTQTAFRFAGDGMISRFGLVAVARVSAIVMALGVALISFSPFVPLVLLGCLLIGAGIAITMPQAFAASARLPGRPSAESVAAFAALSTLVNFMGPPLFGGLAEVTGLAVAFALVLPLTALSFALSGRLRR
jgi:MFS family permease